MNKNCLPHIEFEDQSDNIRPLREFLIPYEMAIMTNCKRLKELFDGIDIYLSQVENRLRTLEVGVSNQNKTSGPQLKELSASFEALLFFYKWLENRRTSYSLAMTLETDYTPCITIFQIRIQLAVEGFKTLQSKYNTQK